LTPQFFLFLAISAIYTENRFELYTFIAGTAPRPAVVRVACDTHSVPRTHSAVPGHRAHAQRLLHGACLPLRILVFGGLYHGSWMRSGPAALDLCFRLRCVACRAQNEETTVTLGVVVGMHVVFLILAYYVHDLMDK
jgi:hypothetical protein